MCTCWRGRGGGGGEGEIGKEEEGEGSHTPRLTCLREERFENEAKRGPQWGKLAWRGHRDSVLLQGKKVHVSVLVAVNDMLSTMQDGWLLAMCSQCYHNSSLSAAVHFVILLSGLKTLWIVLCNIRMSWPECTHKPPSKDGPQNIGTSINFMFSSCIQYFLQSCPNSRMQALSIKTWKQQLCT